MNKFTYQEEIMKQIIEYINENNITIAKFCSICNISKPTYYKLISGKSKYIKDSTIKGLKKANIE